MVFRRRASRQSTSETLVNESSTPSPKSSSFSSGLLKFAKRKFSDDDTIFDSPSPLSRKDTDNSLAGSEGGKISSSPTEYNRTTSPPPSPTTDSPGTFLSRLKRKGNSVPKVVKGNDVFSNAPGTALAITKALVTVGEASNIPYLKGVAGLAQLILETVQGVSSNKEDCVRIISHIQCVVKELVAWNHRVGGEEMPEISYQVDELQRSFEKVLTWVKQLADPRRKYTSRFIRQGDDASILLSCQKELDNSISLFSLRANLHTHKALAHMKQQTQEHHQELMIHMGSKQKEALGELELEMVTPDAQQPSDTLSGGDAGMQRLNPTRDTSMPLLRSSPKIFYGRDRELGMLLETVSESTDCGARIAILGPGGMGKTSLALQLLHHEVIKSHFDSRRYFVACDSAESAEGLVSVLAVGLGLSAYNSQCLNGQALLREVLSLLSGDRDSSKSRETILVLDNFESPWEPHGSRAEVEEVLGQIADISSLTLIITMRGGERPRDIAWTKPFLPPLQSLTSKWSRQIFVAISGHDYPLSTNDEGVNDHHDELDNLLDLCDNLPLAVTLMARQGEVESVSALLRRWEDESTSLLDQDIKALDRRNSLDTSIRLSLSSPRLEGIIGAIPLLSILAHLPDGVEEDRLSFVVPNIPRLAACSAALRRVGLTYHDSNHRLRLLAPIRSYLIAHHAPNPLHLADLESYIWELVQQTEDIEKGVSNEVIYRLACEGNNIESVTDRALSSADPRPAIRATITMAHFHMFTSVGRPRSLEKALKLSRQLGDRILEANCLYLVAYMNHQHSSGPRNTAENNYKQAFAFYESVGDKIGQANCLQQLGSIYAFQWRTDESQANLQLAYEMHVASSNLLGQGKALIQMGYSAIAQGDLQKAREVTLKSLHIFEHELDYPPMKVTCLQTLGDAAIQSSDFVEAKARSMACIDLCECLGIQKSSHYADATTNLADIAQACSDNSIWRDTLKSDWGTATCLCGLGDVAAAMGNPDGAKEYYEDAEALYRKIAWKGGEAECLMKIGDLSGFQQGAPDFSPLSLYDRAYALYVDAQEPLGQAKCLRRLGELHIKSQNLEAAEGKYKSALALFRQIGITNDEKECAAGLANVYWQLGRTDLSRVYRRQSLTSLSLSVPSIATIRRRSAADLEK